MLYYCALVIYFNVAHGKTLSKVIFKVVNQSHLLNGTAIKLG